MSYEKTIAELYEEYSKTESVETLQHIYDNICKLSTILLLKVYPDLDEDAVDFISHESTSKVIIGRVINFRAKEIYSWHRYLRLVTIGVANDWLREHKYYMQELGKYVDEEGVPNWDQSKLYGAENLINLGMYIDQLNRRVGKMFNSTGYINFKRNMFINGVLEHAKGNKIFLNNIQEPVRTKIKFFSHMLQRELDTIVSDNL